MPNKTDLPQPQDADAILRILAAVQVIYKQLSWTLLWTTAVNLALPIVALLIHMTSPEQFGEALAFVAICWAFLQFVIAQKLEFQSKQLATLLEQVDLSIFQFMTLDSALPSMGMLLQLQINELAQTFANHAAIRDWYPRKLIYLSAASAMLVAYIINSVYESHLRKTLGVYLLIVASIVTAGVVGIGIILKLSVGAFIKTIAAPLVPLVLKTIRDANKQIAAANKAAGLANEAKRDLDDSLAGKLDHAELQKRSRARQTELHHLRADGLPMFEPIYRAKRPLMERHNSELVENLINGADRHGNADQKLAA